MIALIDYGAGNIQSVKNALDDLNVVYTVTNRESDILKCDKIIFPGVGEASFAIRKLHLLNLFTMLRITKKPLLGICLGMQLLTAKSKEGDVCCLSVLNTTTEMFEPSKVKVPHMGWNRVEVIKDSPLFDGIENNSYFYFAHSYYVPQNENTITVSDYGVRFSAAIAKDNFYGVQFHPEKSGPKGIQILKNFIEKC
ncbi:imidazole glycerol phosphate synthase, glutamine amidotransferase subunit [Melioribacter roseus P3M-2]|uniref:Imidazole glycerol phosphate synthase subunit HisH n=1 Tax=Melioribacter roseus (strain DSM 23840 / JCM 17771 / VKM B-2668 / P3M-2) TaxID=1191523 RepID=I7A825_MELRP|nr:imidazole glycerol phosphate synthase subunit HisH [Melioribacter roseus]AFN76021.1 imidazole glycerol phosphate synthase, glutamine amidotransferase subunit [Melioribacter roseus P3M-2]